MFYNMWTLHDNFQELVVESWGGGGANQWNGEICSQIENVLFEATAANSKHVAFPPHFLTSGTSQSGVGSIITTFAC